ncbi:MAG: T9SS type A sorting domain-containing protein, partial [Elusimicrobiota bacterium]|nr:T9SS type A sorting domain-containing protein [Elusimicrobiota bacterium]
NVHWDFANDPESGVVTYELQEKVDTSPLWNTISSTIPGDSQNYAITGKEQGHFYFYRVRARNAAGSWSSWSGASSPAVTGLPKDIISQVSNYPNPARGDETTITYRLKYDAKVTVEIYDLLGYLVLQEEFKPGSEQGSQGPNQWVWYLRNEMGDKVAKGGYICRITVDVDDSMAPKNEDRTVQVIRKIGVIH